MREWGGARVVIVGAARQGLALARYLVQKGAHIVINDRKSEQELISSINALEDLTVAGYPITWECGGHPLDLLTTCDYVFLSGGIPVTLPLVKEARSRQIPLLNDSQIFLEATPCKVVGITGSAGKTTTTTLVGRILQTAFFDPESKHYGRRVWVGGNIGTPLIASVDEMEPDDLAVVELSSFQLEIMTISPDVAVVLNISPDHLDRHESLEAYIQAKSSVLTYQDPADIAVLGRDDSHVRSMMKNVKGHLYSFGLSELDADQPGTYMREDSIYLRRMSRDVDRAYGQKDTNDDGIETTLLSTRECISLPGDHNLRNVMAACTVAAVFDISPEYIHEAITTFEGVPHRLEFVRNWGGASWFNDSIATTPMRAVAAIRSFEGSLVLLAGGRDKNLSWYEFAQQVRQCVDHLIVFGESAPIILKALQLNGTEGFSVTECKQLSQAIDTAAKIVQSGDVVLLSPGGTSFDEFQNYEERGERFKERVMELP